MAGYLPKPANPKLNKAKTLSKEIVLALALDEQNPTTLYDASGKGHNATIYSGTPITGKSALGRGVEFDGSTDAYTLGNSSDYSMGNGTVDSPFSMHVTYQTNAIAANQSLLSKDNVSTREWLFQIRSTGSIFMFLWNFDSNSTRISFETATGIVQANTLHKICFTYNGNGSNSGMKIYLDGVDTGATGTDGSYTTTTNKAQDVIVGSLGSGANYIDGTMIEATFWKNKELSPSEVSLLNHDSFAAYRQPKINSWIGGTISASSSVVPYYYQLMG